MTDDTPPSRPTPPGLDSFWEGPLNEFATMPADPIEPGLRERHRLYSLLTMALVASQFNGNKFGDRGDYGAWRSGQLEPRIALPARVYRGGDYLGHNIAAVAVDARGNVIDYDFNHNEVFNSSVEHAESRLVRRLFSLAQIFDPWRQWRAGLASAGSGLEDAEPGLAGADAGLEPRATEPSAAPRTFLFTANPQSTEAAGIGSSSFASGGGPPGRGNGSARRGYGTLLADVTIYTSLESCAQCSGIMALANVREVVYLQYDQGQYLIGNLMYRATRGGGPGSGKRPGAPRPIPAGDFGFGWYDQLNAANVEFGRRVKREPFFRSGGRADRSASVTSFLCTDRALEIYRDATRTLDATSMTDNPEYKRLDHQGRAVEGALSNAEVLPAVTLFLDYVRTQGGRGTQHRV
jgi:tRNA(Arg) A34 adenosine deaminase TadA